MKYDAVLFDVDGTLIDSAPGILSTLDETFRRMGVDPSGFDLRRYIGPPLRRSFGEHFAEESEVERATEIYRDIYAETGCHQCSAYPGAARMLRRLREAGLILCTATSKPTQVVTPILQELGLAPYFDRIDGASMDKSRDTKTEVIRYVLSQPLLAGRRVLMVGDRADESALYRVCEHMADQLAMAVHVMEPDELHEGLYTNDGRPLTAEPKAAGLTYSGGVASCYYNGEPGNVFEYGDVGVLLARAVKNNAALKTITTYPAAETIRATVVGAGTHTTNVSGSTISYTSGKLPIKNIPVLKISEEEEQEPAMFRDAIRRKLKLYEGENGLEQVAIVFSGKYHTTFAQLQELSRTIAEGADEVIAGPHPLILVIENDIAKALGNALNVLLMRKKDIICIDGIFANDGDYIDIGEPVAQGRVVPVVTKTLIFNT